MAGHLSPSGLFIDDLPSDAGADAPLVVLVHGSMDRHTSFARVRARLMVACHVVSYDRRGYAGSRNAEPTARHMSDHVDDLEAAVAERPCTLAGHSYGGDVVLAFAERRPDLARAVVAYEPPLAWLDWWPHHGSQPPQYRDVTPEQAAEAFVRRMIGDSRWERLPLTVREEVVKDGDALVAELTSIRLDPAPFEPANIAAPTLVVCGAASEERHRRAAAYLAEALPAGSLHAVTEALHGGHQSHPAEFARLILSAVALGGEPTGDRPPALV
ncbi:MAG: alpha/beta fold hydrolase [Acidimicrobiales bacterium]